MTLVQLSETLKKYILKEQFRPTIAGIFLNPFYFGRLAIYKNIKRYAGKIRGDTIDIGCGSKPYESLFDTTKYIGLDIEKTGHNHKTSKIDIFYNGIDIPFNSGSFDSAVCFEVLQVIFNPEQFLREIDRVLKPGANIIFSVPFFWDEHEQPNDFARYTSFGLTHLFKNAGYTIIEGRKFLCDMRLLALLTNNYIYKVVKKLIPSRFSLLIILPLTSVINLLGHLLYFLPRNPDMYFGNIILLQKPEVRNG
ncbi:MAG: class I SAM-dependent methyltransferase [Bacteroidota bacterium]